MQTRLPNVRPTSKKIVRHSGDNSWRWVRELTASAEMVTDFSRGHAEQHGKGISGLDDAIFELGRLGGRLGKFGLRLFDIELTRLAGVEPHFRYSQAFFLSLDIFFDHPKTTLQSAQIYIGIGDIRDEGDKRVIIGRNRSQPAGPLGLDFATELFPEINLPGSREEEPIGEDIRADLYIALV